jgi:hypothetical protein
MGETQIAEWSKQPATVRLSKGKPIRCNICWYDNGGVYDAPAQRSFKLAQAYARIGKKGQYRYRLHVDGSGVSPTEAYVYVKWRIRGHPVVTLEPITSASL